jgi:poly-gamma-glutamate synthesis protein (capsule biosynthesis protein)
VYDLGLFVAFLLSAAWADGPKEITLTAGGDVMFGRYSKGEYRSVGGEDPFAALSAQFQQADFSFVNLECPLMEGHPKRMPAAPRGLVFRGEARRATQMVAAGIDVVALANNHAEDLRMPGVKSTEQILDKVGLVGFGALSEGDPLAPVHMQVNGAEVVFLGATTRRNLGDRHKGQWIPSAYQPFKWLLKNWPDAVRDARTQWPNALILVSMHWGEEYVTQAPVAHQRLAKMLIDAGADGVLGHHPHVLQPVAVYKGAPILYSMGNLIFDQRSVSKRRTALFDLSWRQDELGDWSLRELALTPVMLRGGHTGPTYATPEEAEPIFQSMKTGAARHQTAMEREGGRLVWKPDPVRPAPSSN